MTDTETFHWAFDDTQTAIRHPGWKSECGAPECAKGICPKCHQPLTEGRAYCPMCVAEHADPYAAAIAQRQRAEKAEAERDEAVRAVQGWMALDLHMALGRPVDYSAAAVHQGYGSWADWWAGLCAEARARRAAAVTVTDHTFEGTPGPGNRCETQRFGQTCSATWGQHQLREGDA